MFKLLTTCAILLVAAPATAQVTSFGATPPPGKSVKPADPDKVICEKIVETGSRLATKKVCMTAAEWAAQRTDHRDDVERAQKNVGIINPG